jgi:hypothetical protein
MPKPEMKCTIYPRSPSSPMSPSSPRSSRSPRSPITQLSSPMSIADTDNEFECENACQGCGMWLLEYEDVKRQGKPTKTTCQKCLKSLCHECMCPCECLECRLECCVLDESSFSCKGCKKWVHNHCVSLGSVTICDTCNNT